MQRNAYSKMFSGNAFKYERWIRVRRGENSWVNGWSFISLGLITESQRSESGETHRAHRVKDVTFVAVRSFCSVNRGTQTSPQLTAAPKSYILGFHSTRLSYEEPSFLVQIPSSQAFVLLLSFQISCPVTRATPGC